MLGRELWEGRTLGRGRLLWLGRELVGLGRWASSPPASVKRRIVLLATRRRSFWMFFMEAIPSVGLALTVLYAKPVPSPIVPPFTPDSSSPPAPSSPGDTSSAPPGGRK